MAEENGNNVCKRCNKIFSTKYTLKKHIETNICDHDKSNEIVRCPSKMCGYKPTKKFDLQKHMKICKYIEIDKIIAENEKRCQQIDEENSMQIRSIHLEYTCQINKIQQIHEQQQRKNQEQIEKLHYEHQKEIEQLHIDYEKQIEQLRTKTEWMEKEHERLTSLFEKVVTKPVVTNNNTTTNTNNTNNTNNIRGNNNNLQSFLAPPELYQQQVDPDRIKSIDQSIFEKHFWLGQKGIARFCVENIINTTDEDGNSKMLLCCTDAARKRFKYVDDDNHVADDMEARHFIDAVSAPIVNVCRKVYDGVVRKIEDDKKETEDAFDLNLLENKTNIAQQKFLEINDISDHNRNSEYKNEMTILLKK